MATGLEHLLDEGVITEVLARLQGGKEAEVFVVRYGGQIVAAKVYKCYRAHQKLQEQLGIQGRTRGSKYALAARRRPRVTVRTSSR